MDGEVTDLKSTGSASILEQYQKLIDGASIDVIREINIINSNILSKNSLKLHPKYGSLDSDFILVDDILTGNPLHNVSTNLSPEHSSNIPSYYTGDALEAKIREEVESLGLPDRSNKHIKLEHSGSLKDHAQNLMTRLRCQNSQLLKHS